MIQKLHLQNFTCFADNEFHFSEGINVFIGENGTGKTHILKVLLSLIPYYNFGLDEGEQKGNLLSKIKQGITRFPASNSGVSIFSIFKPDNLTKLIKKTSNSNSIISIEVDRNLVSVEIFKEFEWESEVSFKTKEKKEKLSTLFIPSREMLSFHHGFAGSYEKRELDFDETYNLLAKSLSIPLQKLDTEEADLLAELKEVLGGAEVIYENGRFYLKTQNDKTGINLVAEGWRKIATLIYLILNGELKLSANSVLFIDEPEANLNPKLIEVMAKFLIKLAEKGVQIFIATHDYLLSSYLSLHSQKAALEKGKQVSSIKFFGLSKDENGINIEEGSKFTDLQHNSILDEFGRYYDAKANFSNATTK